MMQFLIIILLLVWIYAFNFAYTFWGVADEMGIEMTKHAELLKKVDQTINTIDISTDYTWWNYTIYVIFLSVIAFWILAYIIKEYWHKDIAIWLIMIIVINQLHWIWMYTPDGKKSKFLDKVEIPSEQPMSINYENAWNLESLESCSNRNWCNVWDLYNKYISSIEALTKQWSHVDVLSFFFINKKLSEMAEYRRKNSWFWTWKELRVAPKWVIRMILENEHKNSMYYATRLNTSLLFNKWQFKSFSKKFYIWLEELIIDRKEWIIDFSQYETEAMKFSLALTNRQALYSMFIQINEETANKIVDEYKIFERNITIINAKPDKRR